MSKKKYYLERAYSLKLPKYELVLFLKTVFESDTIVPHRLLEVEEKL